MDKIIYTFLFFILFSACKNQKNNTQKENTDSTQQAAQSVGSADITTDSKGLWEATFDNNTGKLVMKKAMLLNADSLTHAWLINQMNVRYPNIYLTYTKTSGDTIFVKIEKSDFLTQQMGSTGADVYLTEVTYNLTELKNIDFVCFDFKEGDHAAPGTYSKTDFVNVLR